MKESLNTILNDFSMLECFIKYNKIKCLQIAIDEK